MGEMHKAEGAVFAHECIKCKHLFDCQGKPKEVKKCLNFEERDGKGGRTKNVH